MIKPVPAWLTSDGKLFEKEDDAKAYEFEQALRAWMADLEQSDPDTPKWTEKQLAAIIRDRAKLLSIFKLLNGSNTMPMLGRSVANGDGTIAGGFERFELSDAMPERLASRRLAGA
jgi:hypothetical protein